MSRADTRADAWRRFVRLAVCRCMQAVAMVGSNETLVPWYVYCSAFWVHAGLKLCVFGCAGSWFMRVAATDLQW